MESCFTLTDLNSQMSILSKATYRFSAVCIKIPMVCFKEIRQIILKFIRNHGKKKKKKPLKGHKAAGIMLSNSVTKTQ